MIAGRALKSSKMMKKMMKKMAHLTSNAAPTRLLEASAGMVRQNVSKLTSNGGEDEEIPEDVIEDMMKDHSKLIFAEFVFMMRGGALEHYLPGEWHQRADDMCKLREAFDVIDVDGNNDMELDELEMILISTQPKKHFTPEDIQKVWRVLNPDAKASIGFPEFVTGALAIRSHPELSEMMRTDVPSRFQLLSLICDTPINDAEEKILFEKSTGLEKLGVRMLKKMKKPPPSKEQVREILEQACAGKLHYLTDVQRRNVRLAHVWCCIQACCIAVVFTGLPGLWENFLVWRFETDGAVDAYWTCADTIGDPMNATYRNFSLATCPPGLCTSIPDGVDGRASVDEYLSMGGNAAMGGNWTDGDGPCKGDACDDGCTSLLHTIKHDPEAMYYFWGLNLIGIVTGIVFELSLLMYTAVRSAVKVSYFIDLRLTPLNSDRAFVANMLVRTCFELGDPEGEVMGVDTERDEGPSERSRIWNVLAVLFIKGKVVLTGALFKMLTVQFVAYDTATWCKPYTGTMAACVLWDVMMCHAIMKRESWLTAAITMDSPYCSCKLTRVRVPRR